MNDPVQFTIVTNDAERALAESFGCAASNKPDFVRILTDPNEIERMKDGTKVIGLFYSKRCEQRYAFNARRMYGGLVWLDDSDYEDVRDWMKLHKLASEERARRYPDEIREPAIDPADSVLIKSKPEIEKLILSQRWT